MGLPRLGEKVGDHAATASDQFEVASHQAGEHVGRDAWHRRAAGATPVAALRAAVCDSDGRHGAMNTSQAASADATVSGGSFPRAASGATMISAASELASRAASKSVRPRSIAVRVGDHQHSIAAAHVEAVADHGPDGVRELIGHASDPVKARTRRSTSSSVTCRCGEIRSERPRSAA